MNDDIFGIAMLFAVLVGSAGFLAFIAKTFVRPQMRLKERALEAQALMTAEKAAQYAAHVERLEQRVRVLERIAIDKGGDLSSEIEALRDLPPPVN